MTATSVSQDRHLRDRTQVRVVDSDVHPTPVAAEWIEYVPEPYRSAYWNRRRVGEVIEYDAPNYAHARAMRLDTYPEGGGFPGSDPELTFQQLIFDAGSDIGILIPPWRDPILPEHTHSSVVATNQWLANTWLSSETNQHKRWRGSICVAIQDPIGAVEEIERWAEHPYMVQVLIKAEPRPAWGDPRYDPVWEAASRHGLPVTCHLSRGYFEMLPMPPVGFPSYNHDFQVTYSLLAVNQVMSLIFDGVFERFPTLQFVLVEHAYSWILPLMWRMDATYEARKRDLPHLRRKPSEYVYDNLWFTTQPLDFPEDRGELKHFLERMQADRLLLFSSDYPHWTFDDPDWIARQIPADLRDAIMFQNGIDLFGLPTTVPALDALGRA